MITLKYENDWVPATTIEIKLGDEDTNISTFMASCVEFGRCYGFQDENWVKVIDSIKEALDAGYDITDWSLTYIR